MRKPSVFVVQSERLAARPWTDGDRPALERMVADTDMMRYLTRGRPWPEADVDEFLTRQRRQLAGHGVCMGPLESRATREVVGVAGIQPLDIPGEYELGWWIWKDHWGLGYAPEIARALVEYAATEMGLRRVVAVIDGDQEPDATTVSQLLDLCPAAGISVIWLCSAESRVPRQASAIVDCQVADAQGRSVLWHTDPELPVQHVELGRVHPEVADRVARSLAPVRDASVATATTAIPRTVPLLSVLGTSSPDEEWVAARWRTERGYSLRHPVGLGPDGVVELDLVADGPHALIGGTSGAGKSELLQSMVGALIATYPASRLNLLFVDYKGGASSTVFRDVPHTVGYVTNLDNTVMTAAEVIVPPDW